jgi:hypothetical protein
MDSVVIIYPFCGPLDVATETKRTGKKKVPLRWNFFLHHAFLQHVFILKGLARA